jgi:hypothetical protein
MRFYSDQQLSRRQSLTPEGLLVITDTVIARCGDQLYAAHEVPLEPYANGLVTVTRPEGEVFDEASLASWNGKPLTAGHPDDVVTPDNFRDLCDRSCSERETRHWCRQRLPRGRFNSYRSRGHPRRSQYAPVGTVCRLRPTSCTRSPVRTAPELSRHIAAHSVTTSAAARPWPVMTSWANKQMPRRRSRRYRTSTGRASMCRTSCAGSSPSGIEGLPRSRVDRLPRCLLQTQASE